MPGRPRTSCPPAGYRQIRDAGPVPRNTVVIEYRVPREHSGARFFRPHLFWPLALLIAPAAFSSCGDNRLHRPSTAQGDGGDGPLETDDADPAGVDADPDQAAPDGGEPDAPASWPHHGPGGPKRTFTADQLFRACAYLDGGPGDLHDEHDVAVMFDGYLLLPWAPEFGRGGMTFYDVSDPCAPMVVGAAQSDDMRETHTVGFSNQGGVWAVTNTLHDSDTGGVAIWDVSDVRAPSLVSRVDVPGFHYPDGYAAVVFWAFWQGRYLYLAAGDNGLVIVDTADPRAPAIVKQVYVQPFLRVQGVEVVGNLLFLNQSGSPRAVLMDISDPLEPRPIPGGDFQVRDPMGVALNKYSANFSGGYAFFGRQSTGAGGVTIYDLNDFTRPVLAADYGTPGAAGAYVFFQEPFIFAGDSTAGTLLDMTDPAHPVAAGQFHLQGDLDFVTPLGNVAVLSVDENASPNQASAIVPWQTDPDSRPPRVTFSVPADGARDVPITSRVGVTFSEFVDAKSAWRTGAVLLREERSGAVVDAIINAQDTIVNVSPREPLKALTRYRLEVTAGVITDWSDNAVTQPFTMTFETAPQ